MYIKNAFCAFLRKQMLCGAFITCVYFDECTFRVVCVNASRLFQHRCISSYTQSSYTRKLCFQC